MHRGQMGFRERMLYNLRRHQWFEWSSMNRQTILRTVLAAILLAAWISWVFPFFIQMLQMPESWLARKLFACEFPPSPNEDGTLAHAWVLGPLVFFLNTITLLPLALALLFSFPRDRRLMRAWDTIVLIAGVISLLVGGGIFGYALLFPGESDPPLSQEYFLFSVFVPLFVAGVITTFGSYRMLKTRQRAELC